jgi:hypothetical protein
MDGIFDNKPDLMKAIKEHFKKVDAIRKLPEYQEFLKYKEEMDQFAEFIQNKRISKTSDFIENFLPNEEEVMKWIERIKKLEKRLSDSAWKRRESFCSSNIMDHIWEVVKKNGTPVEVEEMFGTGAYKFGKFTMEEYHGQGEYGYAIYVNKRIF